MKTIPKPDIQKPSDAEEKNKTTKFKYRFSFDWLVVYEANDGGLGNKNLELYGGGAAVPKVRTKDGAEVELNRFSTMNWEAFRGLFKNEVSGIDRAEAFEIGKNDGASLNTNGDLIITVNPQKYGYDSIEDFERNAKLYISYRLVEKDPTSKNDEFPPSIATLRFADSDIKPLSMQQLINARNKNLTGIMKLQEGGSRVGISYSFEKLKN